MKFKRWPRVESYVHTPRKEAGILRSQQQQRDRFPLLAPLIAETQSDTATVAAQRALDHVRWQQDARDQRARCWRDARRRFFANGPNLRAMLRRLWREAPYPADPSYLATFLHGVERGRIDPDNPPWVYHGPGFRKQAS